MFALRPLVPDDAGWVRRVLAERWGGRRIVTRGRVHVADRLPGFAAVRGSERVGLATYNVGNGECELVSLDSLVENMGVGTALLTAVRDAAITAGCRRVWLITTNDNTRALRFYQKRDLRLVAVHRDALEQSRRLKPGIPLHGIDGIPLRDEIELEWRL